MDQPPLLVPTNPFVTASEATAFRAGGAEEIPAAPVAEGEAAVPAWIESERATVFCVDHVRDAYGFGDEEAEEKETEEEEKEGDGEEEEDGEKVGRVALFGDRLQTRVAALGFGVVEPDPLNEVWDRVFADAEPIYDPYTGVRDVEAYERTRLAALGALRDELGCDFLLSPTVIAVSAAWNAGVMSWDGATYRFTKGMMPGSGAYGYVPALSLHVTVLELDEGGKVYFGTGGIQPLSEIHGGFWKDEFEQVASDELLRNDDLNDAAIERAILRLSRTEATSQDRSKERPKVGKRK